MALCTSSEVKTHIFGTSSPPATFDTVIAQLIPQVDIAVENACDVRTVATNYDDIVDEIDNSDGTAIIRVQKKPIRDITSIEYRDGIGETWRTYDQEVASQIDHDEKQAEIYTRFVVTGRGFRNLRINYSVGYKTAEVPKDLNLAAILMVAGLFNQRNSVGFSEQEVVGLKVKLNLDDLKFVESVLNRYKTIIVF